MSPMRLLSALLLLALDPTGARAQAPPDRLPSARGCAVPPVLRLARPPRIDGDLSDWPAAATSVRVPNADVPAALRNASTVRLGWDAAALYVAFDVRDRRVNVVPRERLTLPDWFRADTSLRAPTVAYPADTLAMLYVSDSAELFVSGDTTRSPRMRPQDFQVIVDAGGAAGVLRGDRVMAMLAPRWSAPKIVDRSVRVATAARIEGTANRNADADRGYTVEMAVPWASLGLDAPAPGRALALLAAVNDNEDPLPPDDGRPREAVLYYPSDWCGRGDYGAPATWSVAVLSPDVARMRRPVAALGMLAAIAVAAGAIGVAGAVWGHRRRSAGARRADADAARRDTAEPSGLTDSALLNPATPNSTTPNPTTPAPSVPAELSADARWLVRVAETAEARIGEARFGVEALADALAISPRQLQRRLGALTGQTPAEYLRTARLDRAARLLAARAGSVSEIAARIGMEPTSLSRLFRQRFGVPPSAWRGAPKEPSPPDENAGT